MLVLTRESGQTIQLGPDIELRVVSVRGSRVRVAIDAPPCVAILRGELLPRNNGLKVKEICHACPSPP